MFLVIIFHEPFHLGTWQHRIDLWNLNLQKKYTMKIPKILLTLFIIYIAFEIWYLSYITQNKELTKQLGTLELESITVCKLEDLGSGTIQVKRLTDSSLPTCKQLNQKEEVQTP